MSRSRNSQSVGREVPEYLKLSFSINRNECMKVKWVKDNYERDTQQHMVAMKIQGKKTTGWIVPYYN